MPSSSSTLATMPPAVRTYLGSRELKTLAQELKIDTQVLQRYVSDFKLSSREQLEQKMIEHGFYRLNPSLFKSRGGEVRGLLDPSKPGAEANSAAMEGCMIAACALKTQSVGDDLIGDLISKNFARARQLEIMAGGKVQPVYISLVQSIGMAYRGLYAAGEQGRTQFKLLLNDFIDELGDRMGPGSRDAIRANVRSSISQINELLLATSVISLNMMAKQSYREGQLHEFMQKGVYSQLYSEARETVKALASSDPKFGARMRKSIEGEESDFDRYFGFMFMQSMFVRAVQGKPVGDASDVRREMQTEAIRYVLGNAQEFASSRNRSSAEIAHLNRLENAYFLASGHLSALDQDVALPLAKELISITLSKSTSPSASEAAARGWQDKVINAYMNGVAGAAIKSRQVALFFSAGEIQEASAQGGKWEEKLERTLKDACSLVGLDYEMLARLDAKALKHLEQKMAGGFSESLEEKGYSKGEAMRIALNLVGSLSGCISAKSKAEAERWLGEALKVLPSRDSLAAAFPNMRGAELEDAVAGLVVPALYVELDKKFRESGARSRLQQESMRGLRFVQAPNPESGFIPIVKVDVVAQRELAANIDLSSYIGNYHPAQNEGMLRWELARVVGLFGFDVSNGHTDEELMNAFSSIVSNRLMNERRSELLGMTVGSESLYYVYSGRIDDHLDHGMWGDTAPYATFTVRRVSENEFQIIVSDSATNTVFEGTFDLTTQSFTSGDYKTPLFFTLNIAQGKLPLDIQYNLGLNVGVPVTYDIETKLPREYAGGKWTFMPFASLSRPINLGAGWFLTPGGGVAYSPYGGSFQSYGGLAISKTFRFGRSALSIDGGAGFSDSGPIPYAGVGASLYGVCAQFSADIKTGRWLNARIGWDRDQDARVDFGIGATNAGPIIIPSAILFGMDIMDVLVGAPTRWLKRIYNRAKAS